MNKRRKIFQRAAALLCCMVLLPSLFVFSVSAESDDGFFDVLQFGTANGSGSQVVTGAVPFDVVYQTTAEPFFYVDAVIVSPTMVFLEYNGQPLTRQIINYSNGSYRFRMYGNLVGDPSGYLSFRVTSPGNNGATVSVIFEQLRVSSMNHSQSFKPTVGTVFASPYEWVPSETMPDSSTPATITFKSNNVSFAYDYFAKLSFDTWQLYDYLDVYFTIRAASINSISVQLGDVFVPYELTYLDSGLVPDSSWGSDGAAPADNVYDCTMRIDLTGLYRNVGSDVLTILINGSYMPYLGAQGVSLTSVTGVVIGSVPSETATFWQRLQGFWVGMHADLKSFIQGLFLDLMNSRRKLIKA